MTNADIIKQSVTMEQAAEHYGFKANRGGFICCPFHGEKTPSCKLYSHSFYCFGCQKHGSVINFVMELNGTSFSEACKELNSAFSLGLDFGRVISPAQRKEQAEAARKRAAFEEWCSDTEKLLNRLYQQYCGIKLATAPPSRAYFEALSKIEYFEEMLREFEADRTKTKFYNDYKGEVIKWKNYLT